MMWAVLAPLFAFAPVAEAAASGRCVPTIVHCVIFNVTLVPAPTGPVVVTATRQAPLGIDDSFTLDCTGANCSSVNVVWGTSGIDTSCVNGGGSNVNFFIVTVTSGGTEIGRGPRINLCHNEAPKADSAGIKTQSITIAGAGSTLGGIKGSFATINLAGKSVPCATGATVTFASPSGTGTTTVGAGGSFNSGLNLKPDTYTVTVNCPGTGGPGIIAVPGVIVQPNQITDIGLKTCTGDVCGIPLPPPPPTTPTPAPDKVDCDAGPGFTWIICGVIKLLVGENGIVNIIRDNVIVPFLKEPPLDKNDPQYAAAYNVWSAFRNLSSVFFILVFFLIIIGTAAGFDNYTIKKVLPHLVAGAILVPFSWYLCAFIVDIGNVLGQGLVTLIGPIIGTPTIDLTTSWSSIFGLGAGVAVTAFVLYGAATVIGLPLIISVLLAFAAVFLTLILRKIILVSLIVISPFALLAWVLPNTEKWFKIWWQDFFKLVMMYPIILMLFEAGRLASVTAGATVGGPGAPGVATNFVRPLVQIIALILPLFAVPFAFKFAGRGLSMASNASNKLTGAADKKYGKDSQSGKDAAENRTRNNVLKARTLAKEASDARAAGDTSRAFGLSAKSRFAARRAGFAKPAPFMKTNDAYKLREEAAYAKAAGDRGLVDANPRNKAEGIPDETVADRVEAETIAAQNKKRDDRSARAGLLKDANDHGPAGVAAGNREKYAAGVERGARQASTARGDAIGYNKGVAGKPQSLLLVGELAAEHAEHKEYAARGEMEVDVQTGHDLDEAAEKAENALRRLSGSPTITIAQAHKLRMDNVAKAAGLNAGAKALQSEVDVSATVRADHDLNETDIAAAGGTITAAEAGRRRMAANLAAGSGQGRDQRLANEGKNRLYNEVERDARGPESAADILSGERALQRQGVIDARLKRTSAGAEQALRPVSTADMLTASRYTAAKAAANQASGTAGTLETMSAEAKVDGEAPGTYAALAAAGARSYDAGVTSKSRQLGKTFAQEQGVNTGVRSDIIGAQAAARLAGKRMPTAADVRSSRMDTLVSDGVTESSRGITTDFAQEQANVTDAAVNKLSLSQVYDASLSTGGRDAGAKSGAIRAALRTAEGEARSDKLPVGSQAASEASIRRASNSRSIEVAATLSDNVGKSQGIIDADKKDHVSADTYISNSREKTGRTLVDGSGTLKGTANERNDEIDAQMARSNPGVTYSPGTPAYIAARDQATAKVRDTRLTAANIAARTKAERVAGKQTNTDRGIIRDMESKVSGQVQDDQTQLRASAARIQAASVTAGVALPPGYAMAQAIAATGLLNNPSRSQAEAKVRQKDLKALGTKTEQEAAFANRREIEDAVGITNELDDEIINSRSEAILAASVAAGRALSPATALANARAAGEPSAAELSTARANRLTAAGKLTRDTAESKAREDTSTNTGTARSIDKRIDDEHARQTAEHAAGIANGTIAPGTLEPSRKTAEADVRREVLGAVGNKGIEDSADKHTRKVSDILGNEDARENDINSELRNAQDAELQAEYARQTTAHIAGSLDGSIARGTAAPTLAKVAETIRATGSSVNRSTATAAVEKRNIDIANQAARIGGQKSRIGRPNKDQGVIKVHDAAVKLEENSDIDRAKNDALAAGQTSYKETYDSTYKDAAASSDDALTAIEDAAFTTAYNREIAEGNNPAQARIVASSEAGDMRQAAFDKEEAAENAYRASEANEIPLSIARHQAAFTSAYEATKKREIDSGKSKEDAKVTAISEATEFAEREEDTSLANAKNATIKIREDQKVERASTAADAQGKIAQAATVASSRIGTSIAKEDASRNVIEAAGIAAQESTLRSEAASQASTSALASAVAGGTVDAESRVRTYTQSKVAELATETSKVNAFQQVTDNRTSRGIAEKSYNERVRDSEADEHGRLLDNLAAQASVATKFSSRGEDGNPILDINGKEVPVSIKDAGLSTANINAIIELIRTGDDATQIAGVEKLSGPGSSQQSFEMLKSQLVGKGKFFGGDMYNTVDPKHLLVWDKGVRNAKAADARIPPVAAFTSPSAEGVANWSYGDTKRAITFYDNWTEEIRNIADPAKQAKAQLSFEKEKKELNAAFVKAATTSNLQGKIEERSFPLLLGNDPSRPIPPGLFDPLTLEYVQILMNPDPPKKRK